jgi:hypothetical protein
MTTRVPERREGAAELAADGIRVQAGFRVTTAGPLAGGPVELQFFVQSPGPVPLRLVVSGDRARQRPGKFSFEATFEGVPLEDPMAGLVDVGGPAGVVAVSADRPWQQPLVLNEFVRLERAPTHIAAGASGRLTLRCRRAMALAATDAAAFASRPPRVVLIDLAVDLRRDDAELAALTGRLLDEVVNGPPAARERPLALLLSLRSIAHAQIEALTGHPDPVVAARANQALARAIQDLGMRAIAGAALSKLVQRIAGLGLEIINVQIAAPLPAL